MPIKSSTIGPMATTSVFGRTAIFFRLILEYRVHLTPFTTVYHMIIKNEFSLTSIVVAIVFMQKVKIKPRTASKSISATVNLYKVSKLPTLNGKST